jgi:hypothetical protein
MPAVPLTSHQLEVLNDLFYHARRPGWGLWARPLDLGARDSSHHSRTLAQLCRLGLVERARRNTLLNVIGAARRGSWKYRITPKGRARARQNIKKGYSRYAS